MDHKQGEEDNKNQVLLTPNLFQVNANTTASGAQLFSGEGDAFLDHVRNFTDRNEKVIKAVKELGSSGNLQGEGWSEESKLILYHNWVYLSLDSELRYDIVKTHHDTPLTRHPGF